MQISIRRTGFAAFALVLGLAAPGGAQPARWDKTISVEARAPDHKPDGKPWDFDIPVMIGPVMPNAGNPAPDMMLCVVDEEGGEFCIHEARRNPAGVPYSICQDKYVCNFTNVKVPSSGYYGILLIDLDPLPNKQDYMLGAILRNGGPSVPATSFKIEKAIKRLCAKWNCAGEPDEFPEAVADDCNEKNPCFGDSRGGIPSLSISAPDLRPCGMPISGKLDFGPGETSGSVSFELQLTENECLPGVGTLEYVWQFGDGAVATSRSPQASHSYAKSGSFTVRVVPHCVRKTSICEAPAQSAHVSLGR